MKRIPAVKDPARNVWLQLGMPDAEEHYLKAELVLSLHRAISAIGLTQRAAAKRIGTTQPELSKILRGKFSEVSLERLMRFLTALGHPIEIKIGAAKPRVPGEVTIRRTRSHSFGFKPGIDLDKLGQLADELEAEGFSESAAKRHDPPRRQRSRSRS
jgi:predicted XRE-type DNA-binding protein